jgi:hypothetical protein
MPRRRRHMQTGRRAPERHARGGPRASASPLAMAGIFIAQSWAPLPNESRALSGTASLSAPGPQCAQSRTTTQRARTLGIAAESGHIGNLQSTQPSTTIGVPPPALHNGRTSPRGEPCPQYFGRRRSCAGPRRPSPIDQAAQTQAQAAPRRTLSLTIASQTIASSPDGSESNSAANCTCGAPAANVGSGWRFRASSTVTSSSSPCDALPSIVRAYPSGTQ